jgi:predicted DNA-binding protein with PD1-like motif
MRSKLLESGPAKAWALILESGDEFSDCISRFATENHLTAASFTGIGAFRQVVVGYFEWDRKDYKRIPFDEQVEVLALTGDVSLDGGKPKAHAHAVLGRADGSACGGHLLTGHVRPTLELVIRESPQNLERVYDPESGLNLIKP